MRFFWISLVFYLLVEAYFAALRVAKKRQLAQYSAPSRQTHSAATTGQAANPVSASQASIAAPEAASASSLGSAEQELDEVIEAVFNDSSNQPEAPEVPIAEPAIYESVDPASNPENPLLSEEPQTAPELPNPIAQMLAPDSSELLSSASSESGSDASSTPSIATQPEFGSDFPLAASLAVTDLVNPRTPGSVEIPDLIPTDPAISEVLNANAESRSNDHPSILEEIAELRPTADAQFYSAANRTKHFMHALLTGDGTVRVAAVYELGEIAAQGGHDKEQIIEQLQQLTQDDDPDVRSQAIVALGKVQR